MLIRFVVLVSLFGLGITAFPDTSSAQNIAAFAGCTGTDCTACNIVDLVNGGLQWFLGFLFVLFAVLVAWAGFGLVTSSGNHHALDEAKSKFTNAIVGLIIILAAWLIVDTIMRGLVGQTGGGNAGQVNTASGWLMWSEIECMDHATIAQYDELDPFNTVELDVEEPPLPPSVIGGDISTFPLGPGGGGTVPPVPAQPAGQVCYPGTGSGAVCFPTVTGIAGTQGYVYPSNFAVPPYWIDTQNLGGGRTASTRVSPNYTLAQLNVSGTCGNGGRYMYVNPTALQRVERMNLALGTRLTINSAHRSPGCNDRVDGAARSVHMTGNAFDLNISGGDRCAIIRACRAQGAGFIMTYPSTGHVHCDWGPSRGESLTISCPR